MLSTFQRDGPDSDHRNDAKMTGSYAYLNTSGRWSYSTCVLHTESRHRVAAKQGTICEGQKQKARNSHCFHPRTIQKRRSSLPGREPTQTQVHEVKSLLVGSLWWPQQKILRLHVTMDIPEASQSESTPPVSQALAEAYQCC